MKNVYDNIWFYKTRGKYRSLSTSFIMASNLNKEGNLNQVTLGYLSYENIRDHFLTSVFLDLYKAVSHQTFYWLFEKNMSEHITQYTYCKRTGLAWNCTRGDHIGDL